MTPTIAYVLYALFALAGAGVYLTLPGVRSLKAAGVLVGLAAVAGLMILLATRVVFSDGSLAYFIIFGSIALLATARVITHEKPVYSAVYFVLVVLSVAFLLVVQQAEFLAVALVIIYAGAILVTYVFVIMLAQQSGAPAYDRRAREPLAAVLLGFLTMAAIAGRVADLPPGPASANEVARLASSVARSDRPHADSGMTDPGNTVAVGQAMLTRYVIALEIAGVLLLVAMIGAIAMARKRVPADEYVPPPPEPGAAGRTVAPF